ncbi:MAG: hypothetical protein ACMXYA_03515, partial [Candidatus Woesearchaeota archaeon]
MIINNSDTMSRETKKSIDLPLSEITLRRYEKPYNLHKRDLVMRLCLSIGLLQPGDSRDVVVDVLYVLLAARSENKLLSSYEVRERVVACRREHELELLGIADSNIRRQLKRLRDLFIVEKLKNNYRITENERLAVIFTEKIESYLFPTIL